MHYEKKNTKQLETFANLATSQVISRIIQISGKNVLALGNVTETGQNEIMLSFLQNFSHFISHI